MSSHPFMSQCTAIQLKKSGIPLTIGILNPTSTDTGNLESSTRWSGFQGVKFRIQNCLGRIILFTREKTSFAILIGRIDHFFTCENHRSLLSLARTNLRMKIYDIAVWWVFLIIYIINSNMPKPWKWYHFRAELLRVGHCREYLSRLTRFTE